jgi:pantothenate kinase type III
MVEGMLKKCEQELGEKPVVIATGGFSNVIPKYMERKFDLTAPDLTLEVLRDLYLLNKTDQPVYRF